MIKHKSYKAFTIIEVVLVLAIAALLFVGVIGGTSVNIARQRYNDSVQNFAEFMRRVYSEVVNTQNPREDEIDRSEPCTILSGVAIGSSDDTTEGGRTNCLIYGKLVTFGEDAKNSKVYTYDVIGEVAIHYGNGTQNVDGLGVQEGLYMLSADVITARKVNGNCSFALAGNSSSYLPEWDARLETTAKGHQLFTGTLLIVRAPSSGAVHTYYMKQPIFVQNLLDSPTVLTSCVASDVTARSRDMTAAQQAQILKTYLNPSYTTDEDRKFKAEDVNICIDTEDFFALSNGQRRMLKIAADGNNASAVELIALDDEGANLCE